MGVPVIRDALFLCLNSMPIRFAGSAFFVPAFLIPEIAGIAV
jgi:hypothetical protein